MPSQSLNNLIDAIEEVRHLQRVNPSPSGGKPSDPDATRVIGRASVVLLSSHLERYIRGVNEETVEALNGHKIHGHLLSESVRLEHSRGKIDELALTQWDKRRRSLEAFTSDESWLWQPSSAGALEHRRLLTWMKSPSPNNLMKFYALWGIENIFDSITRSQNTRSFLFWTISDLVDKRNSIAHGDLAIQATQKDIRNYIKAVLKFCKSSDARLCKELGKLCSGSRPW